MKKLICGDNLEILQSGAIDSASVDVIYLDPPFNSNQYYNLPFTKLGKDAAAVEAFKDVWNWDETTRDLEKMLKEQHDTIALSTFINDVKMLRGGEDGLSAYLVNMGVRLHELKRVMKSTASIFLHCDPKASHYLKIMLDAIFGKKTTGTKLFGVIENGALVPGSLCEITMSFILSRKNRRAISSTSSIPNHPREQ